MKAFLYLLPLVSMMSACDTETATTAVVDNTYPAQEDAGASASRVVYRAWWVATLFPSPVAPATSSETFRSVPATGTAYALIAPGWDPASETPPTSFIPMQSKTLLSVSRGETLHITVSDAQFFGSCDAKEPLSTDDATFIAERIFPGELAGMTYDPATCTFSASAETPASDAGAGDAGDASDQ